MCQEYIDDLNHLLSVAAHPKSIDLLQTAILQERSHLCEQTMDSATSKSVKGATVAKEEPKTYCTRITQYGSIYMRIVTYILRLVFACIATCC